MANNEIVFNVVEKIGEINKYPTGWVKEVNLISWNNGPAKVDIRDWDPDHMHMSKGVTLHDDEAKRLLALLKDHFSKAHEKPAQANEFESQAQAPAEPAMDNEVESAAAL